MKKEPKSSQQASVLLRTGLARPHPVLLQKKKNKKREVAQKRSEVISHPPLPLKSLQKAKIAVFGEYKWFVGSHKQTV